MTRPAKRNRQVETEQPSSFQQLQAWAGFPLSPMWPATLPPLLSVVDAPIHGLASHGYRKPPVATLQTPVAISTGNAACGLG